LGAGRPLTGWARSKQRRIGLPSDHAGDRRLASPGRLAARNNTHNNTDDHIVWEVALLLRPTFSPYESPLADCRDDWLLFVTHILAASRAGAEPAAGCWRCGTVWRRNPSLGSAPCTRAVGNMLAENRQFSDEQLSIWCCFEKGV